MKSSPPVHILITGASGGLGGALARHYAHALAGSGLRLSLWGRNEDRLEKLAVDCRSEGAEVSVRSLDITDIDAALDALRHDDAEYPFDLALIASGRGDIRSNEDKVEDAALVAQLGAVNFTAPAAMAAALAACMVERGRGAIVLIGSAAGFHALPFAAAYSGSKAGLASFANALRLGIREYGVSVTLVSPGFIDTDAGRKVPGPKPLIMQPAAVAARIAASAARGQAHLVLPWPFIALRWLDRLLPRFLRERLLLSLAPPEN